MVGMIRSNAAGSTAAAEYAVRYLCLTLTVSSSKSSISVVDDRN